MALTFHLIKIFVEIIRDGIITYLKENNLLSDSQRYFRKERACLSNLLAHYEWLLQSLAEGKNVDIVYLDFAKTFDRVNHDILLHKVKGHGDSREAGCVAAQLPYKQDAGGHC